MMYIIGYREDTNQYWTGNQMKKFNNGELLYCDNPLVFPSLKEALVDLDKVPRGWNVCIYKITLTDIKDI